MSKHKFTADRSDMAHRIKEHGGERRDYDETEREMILRGDIAGAKVHWHNRTGK